MLGQLGYQEGHLFTFLARAFTMPVVDSMVAVGSVVAKVRSKEPLAPRAFTVMVSAVASHPGS